MVEIKIETNVLTHTFNENGSKDDLIDYNVLKESIIEVYETE